MAPDSLKSDAARALAGADFVREQLLNALAMGPRALVKDTYAVKCRIKDENSLIQKVVNKRKEISGYDFSHVTDIVGLRLLTLFSDQLPPLLSELIDFIKFFQSPAIALFAGSELKDTLTKAIVYSSETHRSMYRAVYDILASQDLPKDAKGNSRISFKHSSADKPYSSIHLVLKANSHYAGTIKIIPVEIQLRTAFEDVWAEVDHPRRYKAPDVVNRHRDDHFAVQFVKGIDGRLKDLKGFLDSCSKTADSIGADFNALSAKTPNNVLNNQRISNKPQFSSNAPQSVKDQVKNFEIEITRFYDSLIPNSAFNRSVPRNEAERKFIEIEDLLEKIRNEYVLKNESVFDRDMQFFYFYKMEKALIYFWKAKAAQIHKQNEDFQKFIDEALVLYYEVSDKNIYPSDTLLDYRMAACFSLMSQKEVAIERYRSAVRNLDSDESLPIDSSYRAVVPRQLGYALWERYTQLADSADHSASPKFIMSRCLEMLSEAFRVTESGLRAMQEKYPGVISNNPQEKVRYINNLLYYFCECCKLIGLPGASKLLSVDKEVVTDMYIFLKKNAFSVFQVDTCAKAALSLSIKEDYAYFRRKLNSDMRQPKILQSMSDEQIGRIRATIAQLKGK